MNDWESEKQIAKAADLPPMDELFRAQLLDTTTRVVRARRHRRVALQIAAVALAFVSGMLTMAQWRAPQPETGSANTAQTETTPDPGTPEIIPAATPSTPLFADPEALARAYDAASDDERLRLLRGAGDYELNTRGDVRTALAYYEQWVRHADVETRTRYDESDTWLLASLKHGE